MRSLCRRFVFFMLLGMMLPIMPASVVYAADSNKAIISQQTTNVPRGQVVEDVIVLGHDVTVSGEVSEILIVVDGNIHLTSTSRSGIVVDLGGNVQQDSGAHVDSMYHASLTTPFWNGAMFGSALMISIWAGMLAVSIGIVILSTLICYGFRQHLQTPLSHIERSVRRVGVTGVLLSLAVMAICALCAVTIIGLPITVVLLCMYLIAGVVGFSIVSLWFGKLALRNSASTHSPWLISLIGSSLIVAFINVPFIGLLLFCILWLMGVGVITAWVADVWMARKGRRKQRGE